MSDGVQVSAGNVVGGAPAEQAATSPQPLCGDDALLDVGLLTDEFARIARHISEGNRRDLNRLRAMALGFTQEELKIAPGANVRLGTRGFIGRNVFVGLFSYVNGDVTLEDEVLIGPHCSLTSNTHKFNPATQSFRGLNENKPIFRGSWIGAGCTIAAGVSIGRCNLICAGAVVTKNTPDYAIIAGVPGKEVGKVNASTGDLVWIKAPLPTPPESFEDLVAKGSTISSNVPRASLGAVHSV